MLGEGLGSFLAHQSLQRDVKGSGPWSGPIVVHGGWEGALPLIEEGFPHSAPDPVQHTGEGDGALYLLIFGQHHHKAHGQLGGKFRLGFHGLQEAQQWLQGLLGCCSE